MKTLDKSSFIDKVFDFEASADWKFKGSRPAIIDFYADWCAPCRALGPVLEEVAKSYSDKVDVYKVNTEKSPELAAMFGVRGIPAILFIPQNGQPVMSSGFMPKESFDRAISEVFNIRN